MYRWVETTGLPRAGTLDLDGWEPNPTSTNRLQQVAGLVKPRSPQPSKGESKQHFQQIKKKMHVKSLAQSKHSIDI